MNLVIDQGNTVSKLAVFSAGEILARYTEAVLTTGVIENIMKEHPGITKAILSSVAKYGSEVPDYLSKKMMRFVILDASTPIPIKNLYKTPETLGFDRIADAVGAEFTFPGSNLLIVDAGTAITIDLVTSKGEFFGGNISPGLELRFRALHEFTSRLPKVEKEEEFPLLGKTTGEAILAGVLNGAVFELEGYIESLRLKYPDLKVILTGGDIKYFDGKLKNSIFVHSNLNLTGLNRILEFNVEI
jgi:type III pantothenate kinase